MRKPKQRHAPSTANQYIDAFSQGRDRWVSIDGKPPKFDKRGRLAIAFTTALHNEQGDLLKLERWSAGVLLPTPPGVLEREAIERERKRTPSNGETSVFKLTRTGKRKRKADRELTTAQLAKREKRRQYNKRRKTRA